MRFILLLAAMVFLGGVSAAAQDKLPTESAVSSIQASIKKKKTPEKKKDTQGIQTTFHVRPVIDWFTSDRALRCADNFNIRRCRDIDLPQINNPLSGRQTTWLISIDTSYKKLALKLNTSFVKSLVHEEFGDSEFKGLTDTGANLQWIATDRKDFGIIFDLSASLPTGSTRLSPEELNAFPVDGVMTTGLPGWGLDWGGRVQFLRKLGKFILSFEGRGTHLGSYDPTSETDGDTVPSGNQWTAGFQAYYRPSGDLTETFSLSDTFTRGIGVDSETQPAAASAKYSPGNFRFSGSTSFSRTSSSRDSSTASAFLAERREDLSEGEGWRIGASAGYFFRSPHSPCGRLPKPLLFPLIKCAED